MRGVDTNILVRFLVGDDKVQSKKVYNLFKQAEIEKDEFYISLLVILELVWVLESVYQISRADILDSIGELLLMPILKFEKPSTVQQFILSARGNKYDLSDLLIAHSAKLQGCEAVLTFDKKASRFNLFEFIK